MGLLVLISFFQRMRMNGCVFLGWVVWKALQAHTTHLCTRTTPGSGRGGLGRLLALCGRSEGRGADVPYKGGYSCPEGCLFTFP